MKKIIVILFFIPLFSFAQKNLHEIGIWAGGDNYVGDLSRFPMAWNQFEPGGGLFYRTWWRNRYALRAQFSYMHISGNDKNNNFWNQQRRLTFESPIYELAIIGEINLFQFYPCYGYKFTIYFAGGVAGFYFHPTPEGGSISLRDIGTEGQGLPGYQKKYSLFQPSLPFGGGAKLALSNKIVLGGEVLWRKTFTDYLDDVSTQYVPYDEMVKANGIAAAVIADPSKGQYFSKDEVMLDRKRGDPFYRDWYGTINITLSYILNNNCHDSKIRRYYGKRINCYKF